VILSSDEAPLLERSLEAALAEDFEEALVIDNASRDGTAEVARARGVPVLGLPRRVPYTEAMNAGLERVEADAVALLQADTFVAPGYLAACAAALQPDPRIGSVAPKLVRALAPGPGGRLGLLDAAAMGFDRRRKNYLVGHGAAAGAYATPGECFGADGAAAFWRRDALADCAIGGEIFDTNMPGWGCDADLAWRARLLGWRCRYEPRAVAYHIRTYSPTTRARMAAVDRRTQFRNRLLMIAKNDGAADLARDAPALLGYELLALGYALLRERELLPGYREAAQRLPRALRARSEIRRRRRVARVPFGLEPPAGAPPTPPPGAPRGGG
jgi:GT2 family glycosyltransferase